ncbi:molybdenum cofactor guanylyltransferase [Anaeromyxobacter paludicola]|uniref:Probable molybdenum cofactor guanylyltransferase n=1 Tax=Anaeromyxobacter paludicola TaxID=2918171 RepID=A0ABN6NA10_9BACT|nr:molybdenum cofactor guanylyltransferase [Anaeromyxobacter paludicola]BDG08797.1 putative molybdenum cofactor guanylyltransferase [Anaeromyxobacter paludicola]
MTGLIEGASGALVAGGRGTRLGGAAKGLLRIDGQPIVARSLALLRRLFDEALVVANDPAPYLPFGAPVIPDVVAGKGAPGGVHAALRAASAEWVFVAACDMPFVSEAGIRLLAARRAGAPAVVVRFGGRLEPLHAFWSKACLPVLEAELARDEVPGLQRLAVACGAAVVEEEAWRAVDPLGRAFENANTPDDLVRLGLERP